MSLGFILAFHSQNISGNEFATNDHVALDHCLRLIRERRLAIVSLREVALKMRSGRHDELPQRYVAISFDDGPDYDWLPVEHPLAGRQEPMGAILKRHSRGFLGLTWRKIRATSFVIASPVAREEISGPAEANPDRMSDTWWRPAHASGFLEIGNHGWDHVHPSVSEMKSRPGLIERFDQVTGEVEAIRQIKEAAAYIRSKAGEDAGRLFAYPYGQVSEYLAADYFPRQTEVIAAFTTEGVPVTASTNLWKVPRYVCGWHFRNLADLDTLLTSAPH